MARMSRLAIAGHPHLLFQRGNDRTTLFRDDEDRERYLAVLREAAAAAQVAVHAYVMMDDHVHLLATPAAGAGLSRMMQALGRNYVGWFNHRHQRSGTLWEGRFRSGLIEAETWLLPCMRYIELNPVRAGLVADPADYRWSSARHHLGQRTDALLSDHALFWALGNTPFDREAAWRDYLAQPPLAAEVQQVTASGLRGWALGRAGFLERMNEVAGRRLVPARRGRPRKL
ncbi:MAG: transposase [Pseudomonadales bacterium]|nr:transposase [Pseudomonadales bacterium]